MIGGIDARKDGSNLHVNTNNLELLFATENNDLLDKMEAIANVLTEIGLFSKTYKSEKEVIWQKLGRLSIVSSLTAAAEQNLGFIRNDPNWKKILLRLIDEVVEIAHHDGFEIKYDDILKKIETMPNNLTTSLQRDVSKKLPSELDAIVGAIINLGKKNNCNTETFEYMYHLISSKYNS
jgi:2-dehydropantoate 2-reductase